MPQGETLLDRVWAGVQGEDEFQAWYGNRAKMLGLDPNPDAPEHHYDYRAAHAAGAEPNAEGHWPSQFKAKDHPNRYVGGVDTITGKPKRSLVDSMWDQVQEPPGAVENFVARLARGFSGATESSISMLGHLRDKVIEETGLPRALVGGPAGLAYDAMPKLSSQEAGSKLQEGLGIEEDPAKTGSFWQHQVPEGLGSTLGMGAQTVAAGPVLAAGGAVSTGAAMAGSAATGALTNAGSAYEETLAKTGDESKAWDAAGWNALIGTTEAADAVVAMGGGKLIKNLVLGRKLASLDKKLGGLLKDVIFGTALESQQEGLQQVAQALVKEKLTGEEQDYLQEYLQAAKVGGAIGFLFGGAGSLTRLAAPEQKPDIELVGLAGVDAVQVDPSGTTPFLQEETPPPAPIDQEPSPSVPPAITPSAPEPGAAPPEPATPAEVPTSPVETPPTTPPSATETRATPTAEVPAPSTGPTLPKEIAGAKPRYGYRDKNFELQFESDIDRALFITAQKTKSKRDGDYRSWLHGQGLSEKEIDDLGPRVRAEVKKHAAGAFTKEGTRLEVPATGVRPVTVTQEAPAAIEPIPAVEPTKPTEFHDLGDTTLTIPGREEPVPARLLVVDASALKVGSDSIQDLADEKQGPGIVRDSGEVLGGNERVRGAKEAYREGGEAADQYRAAVVKYAADLGLDVSNLKNPVVVRVVPADFALEGEAVVGSIARPSTSRQTSLIGSLRQPAEEIDPPAHGTFDFAEHAPLGGGAVDRPADPILGSPTHVRIPARIARRILSVGQSLPGRLVSWRHVQDAMVDVVRTAGIDPAVRTGRMGVRWAGGTFGIQSHVIRLLEADDVRTLCHEAGHAIDKAVFGMGKTGPYAAPAKAIEIKRELLRLGHMAYPSGSPQPARGYKVEGWADFVRYFVTEPAKAKQLAPHLYDWFQNDYLTRERRDLGEKFDATRELWDRWANKQGPLEREKATRIDRASFKSRTERVRAGLSRFFSMSNHIDIAAPIHAMAQFVEAQLAKGGRKLPPGLNPSIMLTAFRGTHSARVQRFVKDHTTDLAGNITGESLEHALAPAKGQYDLLESYLRSKRSVVVWDHKEANPGMSRDDAASIVDAVEQHAPEVAEAATRVWAWWERVNDYLAQASPNYRALLDLTRAGDPGFYVPLLRGFNAFDQAWLRGGPRGGLKGAGLIKRLRGSGLEVRSPLEELVAEANRRVAMAHRELVLDSLFKMSRVEGVGPIVTEIPRNQIPAYQGTIDSLVEEARRKWKAYGGDILVTPGVTAAGAPADPAQVLVTLFMPEGRTPEGKPIVSRYDNSTKSVKWYELDAELYHALGSMDDYRLPPMLEASLGKMRDFFTLGTVARVAYGLVTNPVRDVQTLWLNTRTHANPARLAIEWFRALGQFGVMQATGGRVKLGHMEALEAWLDLGLENSLTLGQDIDRIRRSTRKMVGDRKVHVVDSAIGFTNAIREILSVPEVASRVTEFKLLADEIGWKPGTPMTLDQATQLMVASKQVTIDFTAGGEFARAMNRVVPFYNAAFQGPRATIQAAKRRPGLFVMKGLSSFTIPTLVLWWMNKDEDWWKEMSTRERGAFWHIPVDLGTEKHLIRIPRAFFEMSMFASLPEAMFDAAHEKQPEAIGAFMGNFVESNLYPHFNVIGVPVPAPVPFTELAEQFANLDDYSQTPIVPRGDQEKPLEEQYNEHTTTAAVTIGRIFGWSPRRIDHAIRGGGGGLPMDLIGLAGLGSPGAGVEREPTDVPGIGVLFQRGGRQGIKSVSIDQMYDLLESSTKKSRSDLEHETREQRGIRLQLQDAAKAVSALSWIRAHTPKLEDRQDLQRTATRIAQEAVSMTHAGTINRGRFHAPAAQWSVEKERQERRLKAADLGAGL